MFIVFFLVGMIIAGNLAYAGLVRNQLSVSRAKVLTGTPAKVIGIICLVIFLALFAAVVWTGWMMTTRNT